MNIVKIALRNKLLIGPLTSYARKRTSVYPVETWSQIATPKNKNWSGNETDLGCRRAF